MNPNMGESFDSADPPDELNTGARSLQRPIYGRDLAYNQSAQEMMIPLQDPAQDDQHNYTQQPMRPNFSIPPYQPSVAHHEQQNFDAAVNQLPRNYQRTTTPAPQSITPRQSHLHQEAPQRMSHPQRADPQTSPTPQPRRGAARNLQRRRNVDTGKQSAAMTVQEEGQASQNGPHAAQTSNMTEATRAIIEPAANYVGIAMQRPLFSVAISPAGLGHFGGLQFWDDIDEYLRHVQTITDLHDVCKRFTAWIVSHDMQTSGLLYQAYIEQINRIMQSLFHSECTVRYGNYETFFNAPGKTTLQPESILLQLDAEVRLCVRIDQDTIRSLNLPNQASVRQLKKDSTRSHIRFYRARTQLLGLILASIMNGRRNNLIARGTQERHIIITSRLLGETDRALEANHRGTASIKQKFYYQDEFKNAIAWGLADSATRSCEAAADEGMWLTTFAGHAVTYYGLLAEPKLPEGGILPVPALGETALYHVDQIVQHAHDEMARQIQAIPEPVAGVETEANDMPARDVSRDNFVIHGFDPLPEDPFGAD